MKYRVVFCELVIEADSPRRAAQLAVMTVRDPKLAPTHFHVIEPEKTRVIDLSVPEDEGKEAQPNGTDE